MFELVVEGVDLLEGGEGVVKDVGYVIKEEGDEADEEGDVV